MLKYLRWKSIYEYFIHFVLQDKEVLKLPCTILLIAKAVHCQYTKKSYTSFDTKIMMKISAIEIIFKSHEPFQTYLLTGQARLIQPKRLVKPGQLAGNSETRGIWK